MESKTEKKNCFIITPIGEEGSDTRDKTDALIENVIRPTLEKFNCNSIAAHELPEVGSITNQVMEHLLNDDLVVANLTGVNSNVMYELAVRHTLEKPVITIAEKGTELPFDISTERTIFYEDSIKGSNNLKKNLKDTIQATLNHDTCDNPVSRINQLNKLSKDGRISPVNKTMMQSLYNIETIVSNISFGMKYYDKDSIIILALKGKLQKVTDMFHEILERGIITNGSSLPKIDLNIYLMFLNITDHKLHPGSFDKIAKEHNVEILLSTKI